MLRFALRRLFAAVPLALGVATFVFLLTWLAPGEAFHDIEGPGVTPQAAQHLRAIFGADRSLGERYVAWLRGVATGDLGISFSLRAPVAGLLVEAARNPFRLAGLALVLEFVLGLSAGILACWWPGGWLDRVVVGGASVLYSLPSFCIGIVLVGIFSLRLGWLPPSQMHSIDAHHLSAWSRHLDGWRHLVLPALTLSLPAAGGIALYLREKLRAISTSPFLVAARSRGASRGRWMLLHALANALLPIVTLFGLSLPGMLGGAAVVEVLYAWPGMGRLAYQAVLARDEPLLLGCTLVASIAVVLGSLAADLIAATVDPRIREEVA